MVDVTVKDGIVATASVVLIIISFIAGHGLTPEQIDLMYVCEAELGSDSGGLRQCESLSKYSIEDAKCNYYNDEGILKGDICTLNGIRYAWSPLNEYVEVIIEEMKEKNVCIEVLEECETHTINITENIVYICNETLRNFSDCLKWGKPEINGSVYCLEYETYDETMNCTKKVIVSKNISNCKTVGFNVTSPKGVSKYITGPCCGLFNDSMDTYRIECKGLVAGICQIGIQQTSKDPNVYDEFGMIYDISINGIEPHMVGEYKYVLDNQIEVSNIKDKYKKSVLDEAQIYI